MFTFVKAFLRRGFTALFSYISWQVPASRFTRLVNIILILLVTLLVLGIFL